MFWNQDSPFNREDGIMFAIDSFWGWALSLLPTAIILLIRSFAPNSFMFDSDNIAYIGTGLSVFYSVFVSALVSYIFTCGNTIANNLSIIESNAMHLYPRDEDVTIQTFVADNDNRAIIIACATSMRIINNMATNWFPRIFNIGCNFVGSVTVMNWFMESPAAGLISVILVQFVVALKLFTWTKQVRMRCENSVIFREKDIIKYLGKLSSYDAYTNTTKCPKIPNALVSLKLEAPYIKKRTPI